MEPGSETLGSEDDDRAGPSSTEASGAIEVRRRRRGIFLLPNLITSGALFSGFFALVASADKNFSAAAIAVFVAMVLDAADGRVARLTRTESSFGAEYDSLSDMVAFGVAPGMLVFLWGLSTIGKWGWAATFVYMACAALRLARFNTAPDNTSFQGLASPAAAALVAGTVWVCQDDGWPFPQPLGTFLVAGLTAGVGLLMVSNFRYFSPKTLKLKGRVPFVTLVICVLGFAVVLAQPSHVLLALFVVYAASGPFTYGWQRLRSKRAASPAQ